MNFQFLSNLCHKLSTPTENHPTPPLSLPLSLFDNRESTLTAKHLFQLPTKQSVLYPEPLSSNWRALGDCHRAQLLSYTPWSLTI